MALKKHLALLTFIMLLMALTACGGQSQEQPPTEAEQAQTTEETSATHTESHTEEGEAHEEHEHEELSEAKTPAETVVRLMQMKGHLTSSRELWEMGDPMAAAHAAHPKSELYHVVASALAEAGVDTDAFLAALDPLPQLVAESDDREAVAAAYDRAFAAIDDAARTVAGDAWNTPDFTAEVIAGLLEGVAEEYAESVQNGELTNTEEYQDAYGFLQVARTLYETIAADAQARNAEEAEEIAHALDELAEWLPAVQPPAAVVEGVMVANASKEAIAELSELYGFQVVEASDTELLVFIHDQIEAAIAAYEAGDSDRAYELAASAYLDGFEHLEGKLLQKDPELVETVEVQFKDLRDKIQAGAPVSELEALEDAIEENLARVRAVLAEENGVDTN